MSEGTSGIEALGTQHAVARRVARWLAGLALLAGGAATTVVTGGHAAAASSGSVKVYVSYADTTRPAPTKFPSPWFGSPGVTFDGCNPASSCDYDGGAVMVVNGTSAAVTVDSVSVAISTCVYTWPPPTGGWSIGAGDTLIVDQLTSGSQSGCTAPTPDLMDSSDIGPNGEGYADNCTEDNVIPTVAVAVNGAAPTTYSDSGQVINTGGFDSAACDGPGVVAAACTGSNPSPNCPYVNNESEPWAAVGTSCPTQSLVLAPPTQTDLVNTNATVTATFSNSCGTGLPGNTIDFKVNSGPNAGKTASSTTNASGQATFTYNSTATGTDSISASLSNPAGTITSNSVSVNWTTTAAGSTPSPSPTGSVQGISTPSTGAGGDGVRFGLLLMGGGLGAAATVALWRRRLRRRRLTR